MLNVLLRSPYPVLFINSPEAQRGGRIVKGSIFDAGPQSAVRIAVADHDASIR